MDARTNRPIRIDVSHAGSTIVVHIHGSATMNYSSQVQDTLEDLAAKQVPVIVLDLSDMDFICSVGLGAIITGHLKCRHHNGQIRLVNPQPAVRKLLETTRLTKLFPIYDNLEDAVAS